MLKRIHYILILLLSQVCVASEFSQQDKLPESYQSSHKLKSKPVRITLDKIGHLDGVEQPRQLSWDSNNLTAGNLLIVQGIHFLEHSESGLLNYFPKYYKTPHKPLIDTPSTQYYFSGFWNAAWNSASLVSPKKRAAASYYGVVLEIPVQLILKTYQLDSTTPMHSELISASKGEQSAIDQFVTNYLKNPGCRNSRMYEDETGDFQSERVFAPGETIHSHPFMTPEEMITRGRLFEHNEIKYAPVGVYKGVEYRVKIKGIFYKDTEFGKGMVMGYQATPKTTVNKLSIVSNETGLPLYPFSTCKPIADGE